MSVHVDTRYYEFETGSRPRGAGSWAFSEDRNAAGGDDSIIWVRGTYGEAKKQAKAIASARHIEVLYVLS